MDHDQHIDQYKIHHLLGEGGQASVYLASKGPALFAVKIYGPGNTNLKAQENQVKLLQHLHHPHLINLIEHRDKATVVMSNKPAEVRPMVVLELAENGDLFDVKQGGLPEEVCRTYAKQLVCALKYLKEMGVTHRDIKTENILFDENFMLKVGDFGLARNAEGDHGDFKLTSKVGTASFIPPEMYKGSYRGIHTDIFATGIVIFLMLSGSPPFLSADTGNPHYRMIRESNFDKFWKVHDKAKKPGFYTMPFKRLMNAFFCADPEKRPTFDELQSNQWMNGAVLNHEELSTFMRQRIEANAVEKEKRKKLATIKLDLFHQYAMQDESEQIQEGERGEDVSVRESFVKNYKAYSGVKVQDLEVSQKRGAVFVQHNPAFVIAWLQDYLDTKFKEKQTFIGNFTQDIEPTEFKMTFNQAKKELNIHLSFTVAGEQQSELKLTGTLCRSAEGKVGVDWSKVEGNQYWLQQVQRAIKDQFSLLQ